MIYIGLGGWGSHLERYASLFEAVEINTSFYAIPKPETFVRWANSVPDDFKFSVKLFKGITHIHRLADITALDDFIPAMQLLGNKLGPLLVQLPPSLAFDVRVAANFFSALRERFNGDVVCEPRHQSWFNRAVDQFLADYRIAQVAADPWFVKEMGEPGGWNGLVYHRLHGSPEIYKSPYTADFLQALAPKLLDAARLAQVWCIFDNPAVYAVEHGRYLMKLIQQVRN